MASTGDAKRTALTILHFNDVYQLEPRDAEPIGGADRFVAKVRSFSASEPLILFSGDVFAPSNLSVVTRGKHMVPFMNMIGVNATCMGNHDVDHGLGNFESLAPACNFPWLVSNAWDRSTGEPFGQCARTAVLERHGWRVGLIGLIEYEWLETLSTVPVKQVRWEDYVTVGRELAVQLRERDQVDLVIALTHMRIPNDERLAASVPEIDLVLGGHDHDYYKNLVNRTWVLKSGTDFRELSRITIDPVQPALAAQAAGAAAADRPAIVCEIEHVLVGRDVVPDPEAARLVRFHTERLAKRMEKVLCGLAQPLDARFSQIRTVETNASNWIVDVMLAWLKADVALLNAGSLRTDDVIPAGPFRMNDLVKLLPMQDEICILRVTGAQLLAALENGVSAYPKMEGRFPCVSGVRFTFDPALPPNARIRPEDVQVQGQPLDLARSYRLATKVYLATGRDGYSSLQGAPEVVNAENCPTLPVLLRTHLTLLNAASAFLVPSAALRHAVAKLMRPINQRVNDEARRLASTPAPLPGLAGARPTTAHPPSATQQHPPLAAPSPHTWLRVPGAELDLHELVAHSNSSQLHPAEHLHHEAPALDTEGVGQDHSDEDLQNQPSICVLSSDDEESYPEVVAAHRRDTDGHTRRQSISMDRATRPSVLRVVAVVDGRISMVAHDVPAVSVPSA